MAVVVIGVLPGGNAEKDRAIQQALGSGPMPAPGALARFAGPVAGGWRVISVWESREAYEAFRRDRLLPAFQQVGIAPPELEVSELEDVRINR